MKNSGRYTTIIGGILGLLCSVAVGDAVMAQTYVVSISGSTPNLGTVVSSASGADTVWRINPTTQQVTQLPGGGAVRMSSNLTRATVTVSCTGGGCNNGTVNVKVGTVGSPTNRARKLTNLTVAMGSAALIGGVSGSDPLTFQIDRIGGGTKTFYIGADFGIAPDSSGLGTGVSTSGFYVTVAKSPAWDATSRTGAAVATVYRPIAISSSQALDFGTIVKPRVDGGSISVSKVNGAHTINGGVQLASTKQAKFTVTGEGGRTINLQVPTSFNLTGPSTIPVQLDSTHASPITLGSSLGSAGSYNFSIGGSFTFNSATPSGAYTGTYTITASYN